MTNKTPSPLLVAFAFFAIYVVWGATYLAVIYGLKTIPPFILVGLRYTAAGLILLAWCKLKKEKLPEWKYLWRHALSGTMMLVGGTGMIAWAEQYINSGQAAILVATEPLIFLLVDKKRWPEYFSNKYILSGLTIGFTGIFLFLKLGVTETSTSSMTVIASIVVIISALIWVLGSLITKDAEGNSSTTMNASVQLIAGGIACAIVVLIKSEYVGFSFDQVSAESWGGLLFLIVMGSLVAYLSFIWLITIKPPAIVSTHTYVNPVVAVLLGWLFINEPVNMQQLLCLIIILVGILMVNLPAYMKKKAETPA
ncbi:EamA family transporter [Mucilaginibacter achroorhodeus]|uniref:EamA family transporter n=1 Tax=Mucilaginibacter achroorhodeus TaxID=2599294 RepID=A0A563TXP2_9SPHI|nr:EamA family transporter [Mucilaginibacter achroorhodeus]TWR24138.1 EamA family transporter [Mucilaginibacter achroorhodeus]